MPSSALRSSPVGVDVLGDPLYAALVIERWLEEGEPYCVKAPPPRTPPPLSPRSTFGGAPMFGYSALSAFPLRHQWAVRLAVESLACVVRRGMLSHEVGVNSAAKPKGWILVCVKKFAFLGIEARVAKPPRAAVACSRPQLQACLQSAGAVMGRDP